ncbi:MFS transporter [Haladaptatus sp.]|uniref:MFS transporter n=1 Tax=Haladaptatus sp. TaxID=1973141 RepID=UPI003C5794DE
MRELFRNPTFRRLFFGRIITNAGDSLYYIAAMWLVYSLSDSTFYTGLAGALVLLPQTFQVLTGPLVDRWSLRRTLLGTQLVQCVLVLAVPLAVVTDRFVVPTVLLVIPVAGLVNEIVYPAESAALPRIVETNELVDANSAFSFAYGGVDFLFNAVGGVLIALVGAVSLYLIDSATFAIAALVFADIRVPTAERSNSEPSSSAVGDYAEKLREGIRYIRATVLVPILVTFVLSGVAAYATIAVLPAFGAAHGGAGTYGMFLAGLSAGRLVRALAAPKLKRLPIHLLGAVGYCLGGVAWLAAVRVQWIPLSTVLVCLAFVPIGVMDTILIAMIQSLVPDHLLGRVTAVVYSVTGVAKPVGSLLGGALATIVGLDLLMLGVTVGLFSMAIFWATHPLLRRVPAVQEIEPDAYGL